MIDLERRLEKIEQIIEPTSEVKLEKILAYLDSQDLHPIERIGILIKLGLLKIETMIGLIIEGSVKD